MSALPAVGTPAGAAANVPGRPANAPAPSGAQDDGFARMLRQAPSGATDAPSRGDGSSGKAAHDAPGRGKASRAAEGAAPERTDDATANAAPDPSADPAAESADDAVREAPADDWPPAGLAGFGFPPIAAPVAPGSTAADPALPGIGIPSPPANAASADAPADAGAGAARLPPFVAAAPAPSAAAANGGASDPTAPDAGIALNALLSSADAAPDAASALHTFKSAGVLGGGEAAPSAFALPTAAPAQPVRESAAASAAALPTPELGGDDFADALGTRLQWLAEQKVGHAHIRISPQELGPVDVRLRLDGDRVSADFVSAHADVRQALEHSLPRLREMLGQHGFDLAHASVGQQAHQGSEGDGRPENAGVDGGGDRNELPPENATDLRRVPRRLLDAYA